MSIWKQPAHFTKENQCARIVDKEPALAAEEAAAQAGPFAAAQPAEAWLNRPPRNAYKQGVLIEDNRLGCFPGEPYVYNVPGEDRHFLWESQGVQNRSAATR